MGKEIVINAEKEQTRIAILENGELAELYIENPENARTLGDIYLARVRKIMPSIQAAFVDIGQKQDAFLHFSDLSDNLADVLAFIDDAEPEVGKAGKHLEHQKARGTRRRPRGQHHAKEHAELVQEEVGEGKKKQGHKSDLQARGHRRSAQRRTKQRRKGADEEPSEVADAPPTRDDNVRPETLLKRDQRILVKIVKEPISNKGSRVSTDISLAGRFVVLVPLADYVAVSKKIHSYKERRRLRALAKSLLPDGFGVIVRTVAEGKNAKALDTDLRLLTEKWRKIEKKLQGRPDPPLVVHTDVNMVSSVIRDLFSDDYDRVLVDDPRLFRNVKSYIQAVAPQMAPAVQPHKTKQHIFQATNIAREIDEAFSDRVNLPTGGYLFIERTEAMHVVDVNSGRSGRGMTQEENSLKVNIEAARVIAKQIRLRDLGGIIVIDFIDLRDERNKRKVYDEMKKEFRRDRAVSKILPMSDFGLMQITRQRLRPSITTTFSAPDSTSTNGALDAPAKEVAPSIEKMRPERLVQTAVVLSPADLIREMEQWLVDYKIQGNRRAVTLRVHPFTAAYLNRRVPNHPTRWFMKHLVRVRLEPDESLAPLTFRFIDSRSGEDVTSNVVEAAEKIRRQ